MKFDSGETSISVFTAAFPLFIHTTPDRQILRSWKNITGNSCGRVHERALLSSTNFTIYHAPFHNYAGGDKDGTGITKMHTWKIEIEEGYHLRIDYVMGLVTIKGKVALRLTCLGFKYSRDL